MTDVRPVLRAARRQDAPFPDQAFVAELEARLMDGSSEVVAPSRQRRVLTPAAAVVLVVALAALLMGRDRGRDDVDRVRTEPSSSITTSTTAGPPTSTTSATTVVTVPAVGPTTSTSQLRRPARTTLAPATTTTTVEPPQQQFVDMSCGLSDGHVVVCEWAEPSVAVAEWHVVRRHANDNEVPIPTTHERRITDPTAEPDTTYTYVLNGYDADGRSVVLGSASVSTSASTTTTGS